MIYFLVLITANIMDGRRKIYLRMINVENHEAGTPSWLPTIHFKYPFVILLFIFIFIKSKSHFNVEIVK